MPAPFSGKNLLTTLVTGYIQKRRGLYTLLFSFEYNLLPKLLPYFYHDGNLEGEWRKHFYNMTFYEN